MRTVIYIMMFFSAAVARAEDYDFLARENVNIASKNPESIVNQALSRLAAVFQKYQPRARVIGSDARPIIQVTERKCASAACPSLEFDGEVSWRETDGKCERNVIIETNLSRSGQNLRSIYDRFEVTLCLSRSERGQTQMEITAQAHRAVTYQSGLLQRVVLQFLQLQVPPIVLAFNGTGANT